MNSMLIFVTMSIAISLTSMMYKKKFLLSILMCLEGCLLALVMLNLASFLLLKISQSVFSLNMIVLSAMEASVGMSILTLMTRSFKNKKIIKLKTLIL